MKITWIGQAGLLFDNGNAKILVDPYLSDSVKKIVPNNYRRIPIKEDLFDIEPDVIIFTHDHLDHYDPETAPFFLGGNRKPATVLCPFSVWQKARTNGGAHNYVLFSPKSEWTELGFRFKGISADHSERCGIGVIIEDLNEDKTYYITGDTLYNSGIFEELPAKIDIVFLPINGVGNNMNATDAVRFFKACGAAAAAPYHIGMFDNHTHELFEDDNKIILKIYEEISV